MLKISRVLGALTLLASLSVSSSFGAAPPTLIVRLNDFALEAAKTDGASPPIVARTLALMHLGFLDIDRKKNFTAAEKEASEVELARIVLRTFLPSQARAVDREALEVLRQYRIEPTAKTDRFADAVMTALEDWRAGDARAMASGPWSQKNSRKWNPMPGQTPLLPNWGRAPSFLETKPPNWRILIPEVGYPDPRDPDIALTLSLGEAKSKRRTAEMSEIAQFWSQGAKTVTPVGQWNRIAQDAANRMRLLHSEEIQLFAELNVALAEASVHCWKNKYDLLVLRPVQIARAAGNTQWKSFIETPPHPEYPSGHSTFSGAAAEILQSWAKEFRLPMGRPGSVRVTSEDLPGVVRSFRDFREAAREAGMSRIYGGIHFPWSDEEGQALGKKIGIATIKDLNRNLVPRLTQ